MRHLSIIVPTYNRASTLPRLLEYIGRAKRILAACSVEIYFSENHSTDNSLQILSEFSESIEGLHIKIIRPPKHFLTGEENLAWAISQVQSEYVWPLADDDSFTLEALVTVVRLTRKNCFDLIMLNACRSTDLSNDPSHYFFNKYPLYSSLAPGINNCLYNNAFDLAADIGLLNLFANFSGSIFRREPFMESLRLFLGNDKSPIYAHCFALLHAFCSSPCYFVADCLLALDVRYSSDHWSLVSEGLGISDYHIWSIGLYEKFSRLEEIDAKFKGLVAQLISNGRLLESRRDFGVGSRYFLQAVLECHINAFRCIISNADNLIFLPQLKLLAESFSYFLAYVNESFCGNHSVEECIVHLRRHLSAANMAAMVSPQDRASFMAVLQDAEVYFCRASGDLNRIPLHERNLECPILFGSPTYVSADLRPEYSHLQTSFGENKRFGLAYIGSNAILFEVGRLSCRDMAYTFNSFSPRGNTHYKNSFPFSPLSA